MTDDLLTLDRPVFIVGCGRSGTTLLGELVGGHPDVVYLNEPKQIWARDRRADVWSGGGGSIALVAGDVDPGVARQLQEEFSARVRGAGRLRLVEKTPINAFRIDYLDRVFPDAVFVNVLRDGRAVAGSIAKEVRQRRRRARDRWYGAHDVKWKALGEVAVRESLGSLWTLAGPSPFHRGLLEWRLAVTWSGRSLGALSSNRVVEARYEQLVIDPAEVVSGVFAGVGLSPCDDAARAAAGRVETRGELPELDQTARAIAGDVLESLGYI